MFTEGSYRFSAVAQPFNAMLKRDDEIVWGAPTKEEMDAFKKLKKNMAKQPILRLPKWEAPYMVDTDSSKYELGAVLLQEQ